MVEVDCELLKKIAYMSCVEKKSLRKIGEEVGKSQDTISRWLKTAEENGITAEVLRSHELAMQRPNPSSPEPKAAEGAIGRNPRGELAAKVFRLLEQGCTVPEIVIKQKLEPEVVEELYEKWIQLKKKDVNQPNLETLEQKLHEHLRDHLEHDDLLQQAYYVGKNRKGNCKHVNPDGFCEFWTNPYEKEMGIPVPPARCAFCNDYEELPKINIVGWYDSSARAHT